MYSYRAGLCFKFLCDAHSRHSIAPCGDFVCQTHFVSCREKFSAKRNSTWFVPCRSELTVFEMSQLPLEARTLRDGIWWWHTRRNQISSFGETESPFKSAGAPVRSTAGSRGVRISGSNAGYTMFRGSVKGTGYPLHSPVSTSSPLPCVTVCHYISAGVYYPPSHSCWSHVPFYITVAAGT